MKERRLTQNGNSTAVTLAQDDLDHLGAERGDIVWIDKMRKGRLFIRKRPADAKLEYWSLKKRWPKH